MADPVEITIQDASVNFKQIEIGSARAIALEFVPRALPGLRVSVMMTPAAASEIGRKLSAVGAGFVIGSLPPQDGKGA